MEMIFGISAGRIESNEAVSDTEKVSKIRRDGEDIKAQDQSQPLKPVKDEYVPEEEQEPIGRYWMERDEEGKMKIHFDDPDKAGADKRKAESGEPEAKPEICRGSTDKVDREIEKLKKEQEELVQKISSETDETKIKELESRLAQVERELRQKDNDTYRRQHTVFS